MIYAIRAVGTEFVKIGKANSVGQRLKQMECGCPFDLHIEAVAAWPDSEERRVHRYLSESAVRGEWFQDSVRLEGVIRLFRNPDGLEAWRAICEALGWVANPDQSIPTVKEPKKIKRKDTRFFEPRALVDPIERRRQEREEWWRKNEHSTSQYPRSPEPS